MAEHRNLVITVRLHDGRYHGAGEWRPSPGRLFQALVAGASRGGVIGDDSTQALEWLEGLRSPTMGLPVMRIGQRVQMFVPDNDIDTVDGDLERIGDIRSSKSIQPHLFDSSVPFLYVWTVDGGSQEARHRQAVCALAERLYQFGRGVDMAWAWAEVLGEAELEARLSNYPGIVYRPSDGCGGETLACPEPGSLASLELRYAAASHRFRTEGSGRTARQLFSQPPKPRFAQVAYGSPSSRRVYELRDRASEASFGVWPLGRASMLVTWLRDGAVARLRLALPDRSSEIERVLVGRKADGADEGPTCSRVKIVPLPSIGHHHADRGIRRVLVEIPGGCPLREDDVHWAFSGLELSNPETGELLDTVVTPSSDDGMLAHYGAADRSGSRIWRTVIPAALPESAKRRRIEPTRRAAEAKDGAERADEQGRAAVAVAQALRHADVRMRAEVLRVQREPFEANGERVEGFAQGTRFAKERLWHVEIAFSGPVVGPLVIGDGRFVGLGVMAPVRRSQGAHAFVVDTGLASTPQWFEIARALRRAIMARVQEVLGPRTRLPSFFTGHQPDGSPAQAEHPHLAFAFDPAAERLIIIAPHVLARRGPTTGEKEHLASLDAALAGFRELRAGSSGCLTLRAASVEVDADPLFAASRTWEALTPYQVTRHRKQVGAAEALSADLREECLRRGLPAPRVTPREPRGIPRVGLVGGALLSFEVAVEGPLVSEGAAILAEACSREPIGE